MHEHYLPAELIDSLQQAPGFDRETFLAVHESGQQVTSIRFNPAKKIDRHLYFPGITAVPWSSEGYYLPERPSFTADPLFHAGAYYVQEAGSMFLEQVLKQSCDLSRSLRILDLCAAPGGKSTLIQSLISPDSLVVCNEILKPRLNVLADNITKWGSANTIVTGNDPKDFQRLPNTFDVIVVDAPCSGSGLFRRDKTLVDEWSLQNVAMCSVRQERILEDVMPALKEGGVLIYSTCSYSAEEDEAIADMLVAKYNMESIAIQLPENTGIITSNSPERNAYGYRFYPDKTKAEGFYIAAFKKTESADDARRKKFIDIRAPAKEADVVKNYFRGDDFFSFIKQDEDVIAFPAQHMDLLSDIRQNLYIKKAGTKAGTVIRHELIPAHELAMSDRLADEIMHIDIDLENALNYLRRKDFSMDTDKTGWAVVCYGGLPMGLIKLLKGRINNYYPPALRILNK